MYRAAMLYLCLIVLAAGGTRVDGWGPRPRTINADLVFNDDSNTYKVRSDGVPSVACDDGLNPSRYCAASLSDIGPECSRISYATIDGDYSFRTRTSSESCTPPGDQRRAVLDLTDRRSGTILSVDKTEGTSLKTLDLEASQLVDDVRIEAENMFAVSNGGSTTVTIYLALHSPPVANTTHFIVEYQVPLVVAISGGTRTATTVGQGLANLYDISFNKTKSKMTKTLIGVYGLPMSITAKAIP